MATPAPRTRTRRRDVSALIRQTLRRYDGLTIPTRDDVEADQAARVQALLWVQAHTERLLAMETRGRLGDPYATPAKILSGILDATYPKAAGQ